MKNPDEAEAIFHRSRLKSGISEVSDKMIIATLSRPMQIGIDEWKQHYVSRVFSIDRSIKDMLSWAESEGFKNPQISDLQLSEYTGESI